MLTPPTDGRGMPVRAALPRLAACVAAIGLVCGTAWAQTYPPPSGGSSAFDVPQTNLTPIGPPPSAVLPPSGYGQFDPYATTPNSGFGSPPLSFGSAAPAAGPMAPPYGGAAPFSGAVGAPPSTGFGPLPSEAPSIYGGAPVYGSPPPTYPGSTFPSSAPSSLFPQGLFVGADPTLQVTAFRLFQGPRLQNAFVPDGNGPTDLQINDTDASLVFNFPNFLYSTQPLFVIPSFSLHLWDGPKSSSGADLPPSAYSAFLDVGWNSDPNQIFGTELGVRVGVFTDFDTMNSDSLRVLGKALANFRLTPTSTLKAGVYYLDRNSIKLVPAAGILCQPNPHTRLDLFFPQPKVSRYCSTLGIYDVWWYASGDYGGGSWTIERASGESDSVDLNDIRAILGMEWGTSDAIRAGRRTGFMEIGWVFNREIEYRYHPSDVDPDDAIMFRLGIGY